MLDEMNDLYTPIASNSLMVYVFLFEMKCSIKINHPAIRCYWGISMDGFGEDAARKTGLAGVPVATAATAPAGGHGIQMDSTCC